MHHFMKILLRRTHDRLICPHIAWLDPCQPVYRLPGIYVQLSPLASPIISLIRCAKELSRAPQAAKGPKRALSRIPDTSDTPWNAQQDPRLRAPHRSLTKNNIHTQTPLTITRAALRPSSGVKEDSRMYFRDHFVVSLSFLSGVEASKARSLARPQR